MDESGMFSPILTIATICPRYLLACQGLRQDWRQETGGRDA